MNRTRVRLRAAAATLLAGAAMSVVPLPAAVALPLVGLLAVTAGWSLLPAERFSRSVTPAVPVLRRGR